MRKTHKDIKTISEAIEHLEKNRSSKVSDLNEAFGANFEEIKTAFENLKPHLEELKEKVEGETEKVKHEIENKVQHNPWMALGIVGLIGLLIGWLIGRERK